MKRTNSSAVLLDNKKFKTNAHEHNFRPIHPMPPEGVTAPKVDNKLSLFVPGVDVSYIPEYKEKMERDALRLIQDQKNKELSKRIVTYSPYFDNNGNRVAWVKSPRQDSIETVYSSPMEIDPNDPPEEIGGYKKRRPKRKSNKKKRKSKRKSLKKRRKTRRK